MCPGADGMQSTGTATRARHHSRHRITVEEARGRKAPGRCKASECTGGRGKSRLAATEQFRAKGRKVAPKYR